MSTQAYAVLSVSNEAYDEIKGLLRAANYDHAFMSDGSIDMAQIALSRKSATPALPSMPQTTVEPIFALPLHLGESNESTCTVHDVTGRHVFTVKGRPFEKPWPQKIAGVIVDALNRESDQFARFIAVLNQALECDPVAINSLFSCRVECNESIASHETIQVLQKDGSFSLGVLGLINGLCGVITDGEKDGWGHITAVMNDDGTIHHFEET